MAHARSAEPAASLFPRAAARRKGYQPAAVDGFLAAARESFERGAGDLDAAGIRSASFPLEKGGYEILSVDRALARLEDAFADREREQAIAARGREAWVAEARDRAQEILVHLERGPRERFARAGILGYGYRVDEVDHVAESIVRYLRDGEPLTARQLRSAAFHMQRGGYREEQVDALLDATVEVILAVR